jgi:colicin import membrane protein
MQISKISVMLCACVLATALNLSAQDNPAQSAARAALAAKLFEMDAQTPPATNTAAKSTSVAKPAPKTSAVAAAPATKAVTAKEPVVAPVSNDNAKATVKNSADEAKAKKLAEKKAAEAQAKAKAAQKAADLKAHKAAAVVKAKEDAAAKKQHDADVAAAKKQHDADVVAAKKQAKLNTDAAQKPPVAAVVSAPDMTAPPAPVNSSKQQQLADLLNKYKADQVTPDEYQQQRAAILAQP